MRTKEEILKDFMQALEDDIRANYQKLGLKASGEFGRTLRNFIVKDQSKLVGQIIGKDYAYYMENGRGRNKDQSPEGLKRWVGWAGSTFLKKWADDKGLILNTYAVAWKIARKGIKVPNKHNKGGVISNVITRERIRELQRELTLAYVADYRSTVLKAFKK